MARSSRTVKTRGGDGGTSGTIETASTFPDDGPRTIDHERELRTTGRYIVIFQRDVKSTTVKSTLHNAAGISSLMSASEFRAETADLSEKTAVHFERLGIALIDREDALQSLMATAADAGSPIVTIEPEYIAYLAGSGGLTLDYLRGFRDAAARLHDEAVGGETTPSEAEAARAAAAFVDTPQFTWGLQATGAHTSRFTGKGAKVAILDTGVDLTHTDLRGRISAHESFVPGITTAQDIHGHGTHCVGTACGPLRPASGVRRYGVAPGAQIFVGKVFNDDLEPGAATADVIAALEWAVENECHVASLSLGIPIDQEVEQYTAPMRRALRAGTVVIAAAGNNANRPGLPEFKPNRPRTDGFVEAPANASDCMAVGAIDGRLRLAAFSARSSRITGAGGIVNIVGPGVGVYSSVPMSRGSHDTFNGTSMATPHVAGIAALWVEAADLRGASLWSKLIQSVQPLDIPSADGGSGLVQAPR